MPASEIALRVTFGFLAAGLVTVVIMGLAIGSKRINYDSPFLHFLGFLVVVETAGMLVALVAFALATYDETHSLLYNLGDESCEAIVVSLDLEEFCVVLEGEDDELCIDRERVFNLTRPSSGWPAVLSEDFSEQQLPGQKIIVKKAEAYEEEGIVVSARTQ